MDFFKTIEKRHCCRSFDPKKRITDKIVERIIQSGKKAPSAGGLYPIEFKVIKDQKIKDKLSKAAPGGANFMSKASVIIIVWADIKKTESHYGDRGKNLYIIQDSAAAAENMFLAATALEISTCWIGSFKDKEIQTILQLKKGQIPMVIMPFGYPEKKLKNLTS